jgi:hypothetical protein
MAAAGFSEIASGFVAAGADPGNLFERLIREAMVNLNGDLLAALFEGISAVIQFCDGSFTKRFSSQIGRLFINVFERELPSKSVPIFLAFPCMDSCSGSRFPIH